MDLSDTPLFFCRILKYYKRKGAELMEENQKRCFVMMPFSDIEGYPKGHFKKIYEQIILPAVVETGYTPYRVDEDKKRLPLNMKQKAALLFPPLYSFLTKIFSFY